MKAFVLWVALNFAGLQVLGAQEYLFFSPEMIASQMKEYSKEEKELIERDLGVVRSICFTGVHNPTQTKKPIYLASAGGPGARKSTTMEKFLAKTPEMQGCVYIDPDQRCLKFMAHTYYSRSLSAFAIAQCGEYGNAMEAAYLKWRGASNYIAQTLLEEAFSQKRNIAHGGTSTNEYVPQFLQKIKTAGYEIVFLINSCEDVFRYQAVHYRNKEQRFYQSTPEDVHKKGKLFPQRMQTYFTYADTLYLYWSDHLFTPERLAAVFSDGQLRITDHDAYEHFTAKYKRDRCQLRKEGIVIPSWNEVVVTYCQR